MSKVGPITYYELEHYARVGMRNGRLWKLRDEPRGLLKACLAFTRHVRAIFSELVVSQLREIIEFLMPTGERAFKLGLERALDMFNRFKRSGVFKWAPQVRLWLTDESYIVYLGFMRLNEPARYYYEA